MSKFPPGCRTPTGFTAVEMLAAIALASMLMLGLLAITPQIGRTMTELNRSQGTAATKQRLVELIRRDLLHARQVSLEPGIELQVRWRWIVINSKRPIARPRCNIESKPWVTTNTSPVVRCCSTIRRNRT